MKKYAIYCTDVVLLFIMFDVAGWLMFGHFGNSMNGFLGAWHWLASVLVGTLVHAVVNAGTGMDKVVYTAQKEIGVWREWLIFISMAAAYYVVLNCFLH